MAIPQNAPRDVSMTFTTVCRICGRDVQVIQTVVQPHVCRIVIS